jgi:hypothetical protein
VACAARPRALAAASPPAVAAALRRSRKGFGDGAPPAPACTHPFGAAAGLAGWAARSSVHAAPARRGAGVARAADPGVLASDDAATLARAQFARAAAWESRKGYSNTPGTLFPDFGAFLADVLERAACASEAGGADASALRAAAHDTAARYGRLLPPQRCTHVVRAHARSRARLLRTRTRQRAR